MSKLQTLAHEIVRLSFMQEAINAVLSDNAESCFERAYRAYMNVSFAASLVRNENDYEKSHAIFDGMVTVYKDLFDNVGEDLLENRGQLFNDSLTELYNEFHSEKA